MARVPFLVFASQRTGDWTPPGGGNVPLSVREFFSIILLCVVLGASGCGGEPSGDQSDAGMDLATTQANSGAPEASEWKTDEISEAGLTVSYPSAWTRSAEPLMPGLADPRELVALSTFPFRAGGENCAHLPENAIEDMGAGDALIVVQERVGDLEGSEATLRDYPERPEHFGPSNGYRSEAAECLDRRKAFFDRFIPFSESGRRFYAYVAFGADTPSAIRTQIWTILDRLDVKTAADS